MDQTADEASPFDTDLERGLTEQEVSASRAIHGFNEIPSKEESAWRRLFKRLWGPIPWMIEAAAVLSAVARKWEDLTIILVLLIVNVGIDFLQEHRAQSALEVLKKKLAHRALVLRDGQWKSLDARELVPGDVIKLKVGDIVPADTELRAGEYLELDQAALTGESLPVDKRVGDEAYANAVVKMGEMVAVVTKTGLDTYFGKTVALVARAEGEERSHFQHAVIQVGHFLIAVAMVMVVLIVAVGLYRHDPWLEIARFSLVLSVASIPVALPAVLSVTMAVGALQLAKHQAIVSRLASLEELAGVDVLCSDKTGTLTKNKMELGELVTFGDFSAEDLLIYAALASRRENEDPLESPIFAALGPRGLEARVASGKVSRFLPFDPVSKRTEATVALGDERLVVTKGAPQVVLAMTDDAAIRAAAEEDVRVMAGRGDRALAVAVKTQGEEHFRFVGLLPMFDPPRDDSAETIARAKALGAQVKMLTGDNLAIAQQIADKLGIEGPVREAGALRRRRPAELEAGVKAIAGVLMEELAPQMSEAARDEAMTRIVARLDEELSSTVEQGVVQLHESEIRALIAESGGFAQVLPEDKYLIVEQLQRGDHIVAMTGDGVNDAPALRRADAGIAVEGATDAARAAADLVLVQPGLSVIVHAIEEARQIFGRMKSYAIFRISETLRVILFMTLSIVVFNFYPVTAVMIIILALLNDIPIMAIAYDNAKIESRPVRWEMPEVLTLAVVLGLAGVCSSFLIFFLLEKYHLPQDLIQAILFLKLDVAGHSTIYVTRTFDRHFWEKPYPSAKLLTAALGTRIVGTLVAVYGLFMTPVGWKIAGLVYLYATAWFVLNDFLKVWTYRWLKRNQKLREARLATPA
ncbi:MAG: plasma-membrane proton-efflux P-type ATPase [Polyangiaceae bacterium]